MRSAILHQMLLMQFNEYGGLDNLIRILEGVRHGVYIYKGYLTNQYIAQKMELKYTDINLLMTSVM